jgi:hypothetical protein
MTVFELKLSEVGMGVYNNKDRLGRENPVEKEEYGRDHGEE